jgi:uncharacterized membrane protein YphA (DoxX/SURF4 family)
MQESILSAAADAGPAEVAPPRPLLTWVGRLAAAALGAVLLVATVAKAVDPQAFAERMKESGLTFGLPPMAAAIAALGVEAFLGLLLLLGVRRPWTLAVAGVLVASFVAINGWDWWQAAHGAPPAAGCGCFGNLVQRSPAAAFWQDLLLAPLLLLACLGLPRRAAALPVKRVGVAALGTTALLLLAWRAPALPLDDFATRLAPGTELASLCAGAGTSRVCVTDVAPELGDGRTWVVLADLAEAPHWADALNKLTAGSGNPPVVVLTTATQDQISAFTWRWGPSFPVRDTPVALFRPLYRRLPRSFLSEGGRVLRTVPGLPPGAVQGESDR